MKILKDSNETVAVAMRYLPAEHCVGWSAKVAASLEASGLVKPTRVGLERLDELWAVLLSCHSFTLVKVNAHFNYGQKLISWHETYSFLLEIVHKYKCLWFLCSAHFVDPLEDGEVTRGGWEENWTERKWRSAIQLDKLLSLMIQVMKWKGMLTKRKTPNGIDTLTAFGECSPTLL